MPKLGICAFALSEAPSPFATRIQTGNPRFPEITLEPFSNAPSISALASTSPCGFSL
jgi:hypothetical protein